MLGVGNTDSRHSMSGLDAGVREALRERDQRISRGPQGQLEMTSEGAANTWSAAVGRAVRQATAGRCPGDRPVAEEG